MNREESISKMKKQLDGWNEKISEWEKQMHESSSTMKAGYEKQLAALRQQREEGMRKFKEVRDSSEAAWRNLGNGFEEAWKHLAEGFDNAWSEFRKKEENEEETKGPNV